MFDYELNLELKEVGEDGTFRGVASVYGVEDLGGDVVDKGAFTKTLSENPTVPVLFQHDSREVIGEGRLSEWQGKLLIDGKLDMDDPTALKAHSKMKKRLIKGLSIGFQTLKSSLKNVEDRVVRHIEELKLWEVSVVTFPMLPAAQVTRVKSADDEALERRLLAHIDEKVQALSVRSSTPASMQEPEPRGTKEPPSESKEPVEDHSKLASMIASMRSYVN